jgi:hypothetical protein
LLHVNETPSNRTMTMEMEMSFFKIDAVIISKNTEVASNIDIYAKMKFERSSLVEQRGGKSKHFEEDLEGIWRGYVI